MTHIQLDAQEITAVTAAVAAILTYPDAPDAARAKFYLLESAGEKLCLALDQPWPDVKAMLAASWATSECAQLRAACITAERATAITTREHPDACACLLCALALPQLRLVLPEDRWTTARR